MATSDSRIWRKQIDEFSADYKVVAWDAPGCGWSSDPPETFKLSDFSDCLSSLINELGLKKPHIMGLSFGAGWPLISIITTPKYPVL